MALSSVPDLLSFNRFSRITTQLKEQLNQTSIEAVTGRREDITAATKGDVGNAHLLNKALQDIDNRSNLFNVTETRLNLMSKTLSGARLTLDSMGTRVLNVLTSNSGTGMATIIDEAETTLRTVFSSLQINQGNRNLFSGDATNVQPLGDVDQLISDIRGIVAAGPDVATISAQLDTYFDDPAGGFQTTIYQGGSGNATSVLLANDTRIDFTIRADDPAIKEVLRGLAVVAAGEVAPFEQFSTEYAALFDLGAFSLNNGETGLVELESALGIGLQLIRNAEDIQEAEKITLTSAYNNITARDQFEASTELKFLETQLEASFILTSRLSELTLTNFIR